MDHCQNLPELRENGAEKGYCLGRALIERYSSCLLHPKTQWKDWMGGIYSSDYNVKPHFDFDRGILFKRAPALSTSQYHPPDTTYCHCHCTSPKVCAAVQQGEILSERAVLTYRGAFAWVRRPQSISALVTSLGWIAQHRRANSTGQDSAVCWHLKGENHSFKDSNVNILSREDKWFWKRSKGIHLCQTGTPSLKRGGGLWYSFPRQLTTIHTCAHIALETHTKTGLTSDPQVVPATLKLRAHTSLTL